MKTIENIKAAISGIDGVDSLLIEAGFTSDSSIRHQLAIVRSMLNMENSQPLCTRCNQPPSQIGRGDGCNDPYCPYKRTPTKIKSFPGQQVEQYRKTHNGKLPSEK